MMTRDHGSYVRYKQGPDVDDVAGKGCRCAPCTCANREYVRSLNRRLEPPYVTAGPAREHLRMLSENGIGLKTVAKTTGLSNGGLTKIVYGDRARGQAPSKRIRRSTSEKILAVQPSYDQRGGTRVAAGPVWKMVNELIAARVPKVRIAERLGQTGPGLQLGRDYVTRRNAAAVKAMHDEYKAGQLVTVKRHRNGDRIIAPAAQPRVREYRAGEITTVKRQRTHSPTGIEIEPHPYELLADVVELRSDQSEWRRSAACRNRPPHMWFPARGDIETLRAAKRICASCVVSDQCLAANLHERDGIFAGLGPKARRRIAAGDQKVA